MKTPKDLVSRQPRDLSMIVTVARVEEWPNRVISPVAVRSWPCVGKRFTLKPNDDESE